MSSRDLNLIDSELRRRVQCVVRDWHRQNPKQPRLIVTCGMRTHEEQERLYAQGRSTPGRIVTHAPPGSSLHEYGHAVDFGFVDDVAREMDWAEWRFVRLGEILLRYGIEWGGTWPGRQRDMPHGQSPGLTWQQAQAGVAPKWPAMPPEGDT